MLREEDFEEIARKIQGQIREQAKEVSTETVIEHCLRGHGPEETRQSIGGQYPQRLPCR